jgi:hypothetical protein
MPLDSMWDENALLSALDDLSEAGFDLTLTGFTLEELDRFGIEAPGSDKPQPQARELAVSEIASGPIADTFWISVRGPLVQQAEALQRLRAVELGTPPHEPVEF